MEKTIEITEKPVPVPVKTPAHQQQGFHWWQGSPPPHHCWTAPPWLAGGCSFACHTVLVACRRAEFGGELWLKQGIRRDSDGVPINTAISHALIGLYVLGHLRDHHV
nr:hypothetical protein Iba_chr10cCG4920 [Ipomoea batatas]